MTSLQNRRLQRHFVGGLPLLHRLAERIGLRALLERYVPAHGNDQVPVVDTLMLLLYNLIGSWVIADHDSLNVQWVVCGHLTELLRNYGWE